MKLCGIYLLTHVVSGRKYVGQSVDITVVGRNTQEEPKEPSSDAPSSNTDGQNSGEKFLSYAIS